MFFAAVQKHVAVLEDARLAAKKARGRGRMVRGLLNVSDKPSAYLTNSNKSGARGSTASTPSSPRAKAMPLPPTRRMTRPVSRIGSGRSEPIRKYQSHSPRLYALNPSIRTVSVGTRKGFITGSAEGARRSFRCVPSGRVFPALGRLGSVGRLRR